MAGHQRAMLREFLPDLAKGMFRDVSRVSCALATLRWGRALAGRVLRTGRTSSGFEKSHRAGRRNSNRGTGQEIIKAMASFRSTSALDRALRGQRTPSPPARSSPRQRRPLGLRGASAVAARCCAGTLERSFDLSKSKPARSVQLSARKARSKKAVGHHPQRANSKQARVLGLLSRPSGPPSRVSCEAPAGGITRCAGFLLVWCARSRAQARIREGWQTLTGLQPERPRCKSGNPRRRCIAMRQPLTGGRIAADHPHPLACARCTSANLAGRIQALFF